MPPLSRVQSWGNIGLRICAAVFGALLILKLQSIEPKAPEVDQEAVDKEKNEAAALMLNGLPSNVSGYYEGVWTGDGSSDRFLQYLYVGGNQGRFLMELTASAVSESGLSVVKGDIILQEEDELHMSSNEFRVRLEGVYVREVGRVMAVLKPTHPVLAQLTPEDIQEGGPVYREALRAEATRWSHSKNPVFRFGQSGEALIDLWKECKFDVDLHAALFTDTGDNENNSIFRGNQMRSLLDDQESTPATVVGSITSPNCNMTMGIEALSFKLEVLYAKSVHYTVGSTITTFAQILLLISQMHSTSTPGSAMRVSILSVSQQATIDAYLCLLHLTAGIMREPLFNAFAMLSFFEFVLFAIFEMRYMLLVWRAQRGQSLDPWDTRRELSILYTRFYAVLLAGIIFSYRLYKHLKIIIFVFYSFWIPQIWHCIRSDVRQPLKPLFVLGMTALRMLLPLYLYGCPKNLLGVKQDIPLCIGLSFYMLLQVALLLVQYKFGPHCFVPRRFLPDKHDYFRALSREELEELVGDAGGDEETGHSGQMECVICMGTVDIRRPLSRMVTPCSHFFHPQCLQRWMDVKMECPTCRQNLPPL